MNTISKLAVGSVVMAGTAMGGAGLALADGYSAPRAPVLAAPVDNWSGVYFGTQSGFQTTSINQAFDPACGSISGGFGKCDFDYSSAIAGGHIGLQHQFGAIVLGVEANADWAFWSKEARDTPCFPLGSPLAAVPGPSLDCTARLNDILSVGGRAGWAFGKWLPYVTGGYANARIETNRQEPAGTFIGSTNASHFIFDQDSERHGGWYIGGGLEWMVSPGWSMGLEYRHYEFDSARQLGFCAGTPVSPTAVLCGSQGVPSGINSSVDATTDSITARVSWKFGRDYAAPLK